MTAPAARFGRGPVEVPSARLRGTSAPTGARRRGSDVESTNETVQPTNGAQAPPPLTTDQLVELLALLPGADSVELKASVPEGTRRSVVRNLGMDPMEAHLRQVAFFDTPDLTLSDHGVVVRAPMPEAAIDEHGDLGLRKHHVGGAPYVSNWSSTYEVPETSSVDRTTDGDLRTGVPATVALHAGTGCWRGRPGRVFGHTFDGNGASPPLRRRGYLGCCPCQVPPR